LINKVQNYVYTYKNKHLNTNQISQVIKLIDKYKYKKELEKDSPFFIGYRKESDSKVPIIGNGSDDNHLRLFITSKRLLKNLDTDLPGVYHIDSTYKLIRNGFMVYVFGKTDMQHKFHPIALGVYSHEQKEDFEHFYESLIKAASKIDIDFDPDFIIQDACQASYNAATEFFTSKILMCYFHVMQNIKKRIVSFNNKLQEKIKLDLHNIHMSKTKELSINRMNEMLQKFKVTNKDFARYLKAQWFTGVFKHWQIFDTPPGYAATNSPIEGYNNKIKKIYTKRRRLSVYAFVVKLIEVIKSESKDRKAFELNSKPSKACIEKSRKIKNKKLFKRVRDNKYEYTNGEKKHILCVKENSCSCSYYLKWMYCIHTIAFDRLFTEKLVEDKFITKPKRGKTKKASNCYTKD
jgi:DNA-binding transcriptional regulator YiaG